MTDALLKDLSIFVIYRQPLYSYT